MLKSPRTKPSTERAPGANILATQVRNVAEKQAFFDDFQSVGRIIRPGR
jgi:hypothetical protein